MDISIMQTQTQILTWKIQPTYNKDHMTVNPR